MIGVRLFRRAVQRPLRLVRGAPSPRPRPQEFTTRATVTPRRRRRVMSVAVALRSPEGELRSSSARQPNRKRGLPVGKCSHARRAQAAPRGDSASPCPSLPEPPCCRVQGRQRRWAATRRSAGPPCPLRGHPPLVALHAAEATAVPGHRRRCAPPQTVAIRTCAKKGIVFPSQES